MWCNIKRHSFFGRHFWLILIIGLAVFKLGWPFAIFMFFILPMIISSMNENRWGENNRSKRKNYPRDDDDNGYFDKPKRKTVYIRTSDGEFVEVPADELEYV